MTLVPRQLVIACALVLFALGATYQIKDAGLAYEEVPVTIRYTAETLAKGQKMSNSLSVLFQYLYGKIAQ